MSFSHVSEPYWTSATFDGFTQHAPSKESLLAVLSWLERQVDESITVEVVDGAEDVRQRHDLEPAIDEIKHLLNWFHGAPVDGPVVRLEPHAQSGFAHDDA